MAWCAPVDSWPVKTAKRIRKQIDNWKEAKAILFPEKPKPAPFLVVDNVVPLSNRIAEYVQTQERLDGSRPTCRETAKVFNCAPSTVSRSLAKVK